MNNVLRYNPIVLLPQSGSGKRTKAAHQFGLAFHQAGPFWDPAVVSGQLPHTQRLSLRRDRIVGERGCISLFVSDRFRMQTLLVAGSLLNSWRIINSKRL
jgi:hypothetical protein